MEFSVQIVSVPNSCFQNVWEKMVPLIPQGNLEHLVDQLGPGVSLYYSFKCFIRLVSLWESTDIACETGEGSDPYFFI